MPAPAAAPASPTLTPPPPAIMTPPLTAPAIDPSLDDRPRQVRALGAHEDVEPARRLPGGHRRHPLHRARLAAQTIVAAFVEHGRPPDRQGTRA